MRGSEAEHHGDDWTRRREAVEHTGPVVCRRSAEARSCGFWRGRYLAALVPENAKYVRSAYFHCWHFCDIGINRADFRSLGNRTLEAAGRIWKKRPYKSLPSIEHKVEAEFLRPVLLGESILPFRILREFDCVIPITGDVRMLDADAAAEHGYRGLVGWMRAAEALWNKYSKGKMSLVELFNFHNQLGAQFPIRQLRVVYSKAGTLPAATIVRNTRSVIENTLYWWGPNSEDEAYYLIAILNSETARAH